jgi:formylglycine-generating enzyme required for sulfatase activity
MKSVLIYIPIILAFIFQLPILNAQTEPDMVFVKGGSYRMGAENGDADEKPVHTVIVSNFYIGKYEITVKQYRKFCEASGHKMPADPGSEWYEEYDQAKKWTWKDANPITNVTWNDARDFCEWLKKETGKNYDLPTEAQWEFAARGGKLSKNFKYSGSDNINEVAWYDETTYERGPMAVGKLKPNELGIYDMSGGAWEWCKDRYSKYKTTMMKDPQGPEKGSYRVTRGGSWYYVEDMCRVTSRDGPYPYYSNYNYGFRVVINP